MKNLRRTIGIALWSLAISYVPLSATNVHITNGNCSPCPTTQRCNMDFVGGVDYLYWKPCTDDLEFAATGVSTGFPLVDVEFESICPD